MSKNRLVNTKFWSDSYVSELDPIEKLLFIYLFTNPFTSLSGIYEITLKQIALDTGIDKEMIIKIINRFTRDKKAVYSNGFIGLKNFIKHQNQGSPKIKKGIELSLEQIPRETKKCILDALKGIDTVSYSNTNSNTNPNINSNPNSNPNLILSGVGKKQPTNQNLQHELRIIFENWYLAYKNVPYYYDAKSAGALKQIITKVKNLMTIEQTDDNIKKAFSYLLENLNDDFVLNNCDLSVINSQFNKILAKIKKPEQKSKGFQSTPELERWVNG